MEIRQLEEIRQGSSSASGQEVYVKNKRTETRKPGKKNRKGFNSQKLRWCVQIAFFIVVLVIGWQFYTFVKYCEAGGKGFYLPRPPGVESFLPISALMGTKYFFGTGVINPIHPAGFVIFGTLLLTALFFKRGFCGWICPIGTVSEWEWRFGDWFLKKLPQRVSYVIRNAPTRFTAGLSLVFTPIIALLILDVITMESFKSPLFRYLTPAYILAMVLPFAIPRKIWPDKVNDILARAWKFSILAFFIQVIFIKMPIEQLEVLYTRRSASATTSRPAGVSSPSGVTGRKGRAGIFCWILRVKARTLWVTGSGSRRPKMKLTVRVWALTLWETAPEKPNWCAAA